MERIMRCQEKSGFLESYCLFGNKANAFLWNKESEITRERDTDIQIFMVYHRWESHHGYSSVTTKTLFPKYCSTVFLKYNSTRWNFNRLYSVIKQSRDFSKWNLFVFLLHLFLCSLLQLMASPASAAQVRQLGHLTLRTSSSWFCYAPAPPFASSDVASAEFGSLLWITIILPSVFRTSLWIVWIIPPN